MLLFVFYLAGQNVSRGESYWKNAYVCIIAFVLTLGTRYNRGNDYAHYIEVYLYGDSGHEFLFSTFNVFLRDYLNINRYLIFYIYAIPFIYCGFKFIRNFKEYAKWLFPVFLVSMIYFEEYEIRQAFGFSFVFLFLDEVVSKKHTKKTSISLCILYSFLTINIHSANILFILFFLLFYFTVKKVFPFMVTLPLLVFASYFFIRLYDVSYLNPILNLLNSTNNTKFVQYTSGNAVESWFGASAFQFENERNPVVKVFDLLANAALFYFSWKYIKGTNIKNVQIMVTLTNLYIVGDIARQAFLYLEILNRMSGMFQRMWFLPFVFVVSNIKYYRLNVIERLGYMAMFFIFYDYLKYLFAPNHGMTLFLWDVN